MKKLIFLMLFPIVLWSQSKKEPYDKNCEVHYFAEFGMFPNGEDIAIRWQFVIDSFGLFGKKVQFIPACGTYIQSKGIQTDYEQNCPLVVWELPKDCRFIQFKIDTNYYQTIIEKLKEERRDLRKQRNELMVTWTYITMSDLTHYQHFNIELPIDLKNDLKSLCGYLEHEYTEDTQILETALHNYLNKNKE
jgi:hypothetical protein